MAALEKEVATYNANLPTLIQHVGKFVLIRGDEVVGYHDSYADALKAGYEAGDDARFLVKKIAPAEQVAYFTRDVVIECRT